MIDYEQKTETVLKDLEGQARTASLDMEQEEAAEFLTSLQIGHTHKVKPVL